jgi:hypothetical protein
VAKIFLKSTCLRYIDVAWARPDRRTLKLLMVDFPAPAIDKAFGNVAQ